MISAWASITYFKKLQMQIILSQLILKNLQKLN